MKLKDLLRICTRNLYRRKGRTALTVSGVVIGCCSIVIMISIGIGMKESQDKMLSEMGELTTINVSPAPGNSRDKRKLNKEAAAAIGAIPHVTLAAPKVALPMDGIRLVSGPNDRYQTENTTLIGIPDDAFEQIGYQLLDGKYPSKKQYEVIAGQYFAFQFSDTKRPEGYNTVDYWGNPNAKPYFEPGKEALRMLLAESEKSQNMGLGNDVDPPVIEQAKKSNLLQKLTVVGRIKEDYMKGEETSGGLIMRLTDLQTLQKEVLKKKGKKMPTEYSQLIVRADHVSHVAKVEQEIKNMGFQTSSMESIRKPMEKEARQKQLMLGGLGAISLLVAAIGIANTMIMSITERTREIGIMKALGCSISDIRGEFLIEAAIIGLLGGLVGIVISVLVSFIMNLSTSGASMDSLPAIIGVLTEKGSRLSVIPLWLCGFALLFSVFIGVAAGYYPANKAVRISALEAIKY